MSVGIEKLLRMAEQICANITIDKDSDRVGQQLAEHVMRFWDPRMRAEFLAHANSSETPYGPALKAAVEHLRVLEQATNTG